MSPGPARGRGTGVDGGTGRRAKRRWQLVRAGSDAVPASTRRFMARARRRRMRAALPWAVVGGVLALVGLVAWTLLGTGLFAVREVRVEGAQLVTQVQVRNAAGVPDGAPLAGLKLAEVADRIGALPPVERVTVTRDWPDALVVRLTERTGVAVVPRGEQFVVLDAAGVGFQTLPQRPADLPLLRLVEPGPDDPATQAGLAVLAALTPQLRGELVELSVESLARISLRLRGDRTVFWGDATRAADKARVATALLEHDAARIDVSAPDVVTFR